MGVVLVGVGVLVGATDGVGVELFVGDGELVVGVRVVPDSAVDAVDPAPGWSPPTLGAFSDSDGLGSVPRSTRPPGSGRITNSRTTTTPSRPSMMIMAGERVRLPLLRRRPLSPVEP